MRKGEKGWLIGFRDDAGRWWIQRQNVVGYGCWSTIGGCWFTRVRRWCMRRRASVTIVSPPPPRTPPPPNYAVYLFHLDGRSVGRRGLLTAIDCWLDDVRLLLLLMLMLMLKTSYTNKSIIATSRWTGQLRNNGLQYRLRRRWVEEPGFNQGSCVFLKLWLK